jgi:FAD/FMN-containing dehydrogenase
MRGWSNWAGNVVANSATVVSPSALDDIRETVRSASATGRTVRVAGSGHSFAPLCHSAGIVLDLANLSGIDGIDAESGAVTVWAGSKIHDLGAPLLAAGRAFGNQGDIDRQAIAGAVATGTHGTGRRFGSFSNAVESIELLTADGRLVTIDRTSNEVERRAAALNLGLLGVVTKLTLSTVPAYRLHERSISISFDECLATFPEIEASRRHAEFWWIPPLDVAIIKSLDETSEAPFGAPEEEHPPGTLARYLKPERVDWSHLIFPSTRSFKFVECEHTLPIENGPSAVTAVRKLMREKHPDVHWVVEYRTLAAEFHLLSPTQGRDSVTLSVHHAATANWEPFMRDADALLADHGGRPHWGKLHWLTRDRVEALYPSIDEFRRIRTAFDPNGAFLNDHLRPLFG